MESNSVAKNQHGVMKWGEEDVASASQLEEEQQSGLLSRSCKSTFHFSAFIVLHWPGALFGRLIHLFLQATRGFSQRREASPHPDPGV